MSASISPIRKHTIAIVGAGTGGISVAARLRRARPDLDIAIIDPALNHDYQPAWTLVGGGAYRAEDTRRPLRDCLPLGVHHIAQAVTALLPDERRAELADGSALSYEYLVVAAGIQLNWDAIEGLSEALGKDGVTSNYRYDLAPYTWELVQRFRGGTAVFTQPAGAVKCPGAPQKALYLAADHFRRNGIGAVRLQFRTAGAAVFGVPFYAQALDRIMASYGAQPHFGQNLIQVRGPERIAIFESMIDGRVVREEVSYDLLHVVPPQSAPDFIRRSPLADASGWLDVDRHTLRHVRYSNVFGLGDCTSTPNSKTAAAIKGQAPVLVGNLLRALRGAGNTESYDGYAACPLTTSVGKVLLAEFTYGGAITPSFPVDPRVPRRVYWWLKRSFMPWFYWNILLKGRSLPVTHRGRDFPVGIPSSIQP
ncbi:FAD/NAD(P)-binding oxidoreductase [Castellaniella sp. GW247-6E4]|uniref:NAD(P)/FAD-dependent oxidoreductase n=1 Tax=Castellaniella sp. GW247-6E4 TaxID=3140380 RepID=UPI003315170D